MMMSFAPKLQPDVPAGHMPQEGFAAYAQMSTKQEIIDEHGMSDVMARARRIALRLLRGPTLASRACRLC